MALCFGYLLTVQPQKYDASWAPSTKTLMLIWQDSLPTNTAISRKPMEK